MARRRRMLSSIGIYHITIRGNNCQQIFEEDRDCVMLINKLGEKKKKHEFKIYAVCMMGDHVHLLIHVDETKVKLSVIMQEVLSEFVLDYNKKYNRVGHLFQERFGSSPVDDKVYFMEVFRYIHRNPIRAGMEQKLGDYIWNSICVYQNVTKTQICQNWRALEKWQYEGKSIIDAGVPIRIFGGADQLIAFCKEEPRVYHMNEPMGEDILVNEKPTSLEKDAWARKIIYEISGCSNVSEFQKLSVEEKRKYIPMVISSGIEKTRMVRLCGISPVTYERYKKAAEQKKIAD